MNSFKYLGNFFAKLVSFVNVQLVLTPFKQGVFQCHYSSE